MKFQTSILIGLSLASSNCSRSDTPTIIEKARPAIALLEVSDDKGDEIATGTGFWISEGGKLVSNYHVIKNGKKVTARAHNGAMFRVAGILFEDITNDIVLLQTDGHGFSTLSLGASTSIRPGEKVVVVGNPMGLEGSASEGIVAALRKADAQMSLIQITAPISPGSSGSPVIDSKGNVIGIARLLIEGGQSLNFAVPIEAVKTGLRHSLKDPKPFSDGYSIVHLPEKTLRIPKREWSPMQNDTEFAINFEATTKRGVHQFNQVITIFENQLSVDRRFDFRLSRTDYCEVFWIGAHQGYDFGPIQYPPTPGYLVVQLQVDKGSYW